MFADVLIPLAYLASAVLFIVGLKMMSSPRTAVRGNLWGAAGMLVAILVTCCDRGVTAYAGIVLGLAGSYVLTKYLASQMKLENMLYGVQVNDPLTYGVIAFGLTVIALIACFIPARRATLVDPMEALRYE